MLVVFPPIFVTETITIYGNNFVGPLKITKQKNIVFVIKEQETKDF